MTQDSQHPGIDVTVAHPARRYNYWLGGKDHFAADRASGDAIAHIYPAIVTDARANRVFLRRLVRHLVEDRGIRQLLDIGTGLPTEGNTHEVAQDSDPTCRIVYVDNDPLVLTHARALLTSHADGRTAYIEADLNHPGQILKAEALTDTLDLTQPVAVLLVAVVHFIADDDHVRDIIRQLTAPLAPGSYLGLSHATSDFLPPDVATRLKALQDSRGFVDRSHEQIAGILHGYDIQEPGITSLSTWRPDPDNTPRHDDGPQHEVSVYGALARIPDTPAPGQAATR